MANRRRSGATEWQRRQEALARQAEHAHTAAERSRTAAAEARPDSYLERRRREIEHQNRALSALVDELGAILVSGLTRSARIDLATLRRTPGIPPLELGNAARPIPIPDWQAYAPASPGPVSRLFGGTRRYQRRLAAATVRFEDDRTGRDQAEDERQRKVAAVTALHAEQTRRDEQVVRAHNAEVAEFGRALERRDRGAVERYFGLVVHRVPLPAGFPRNAEIVFSQQHERLVVRFELPPRDIVPTAATYQYLATTDEERSTQRAPEDVASLYRGVISQVALLCVRDLFSSDRHVSSVCFNGHVPGTGVHDYPCMISLNVERADFPSDESLREVTAEVCARHLKATTTV
jgi:restriction system protein